MPKELPKNIYNLYLAKHDSSVGDPKINEEIDLHVLLTACFVSSC